MKKALKILLASLLIVACVFACVACSNNEESGKKGLLVKKIDGVYTVYDYVDDGKGVTELDIGKTLADMGITEEYKIRAGAFEGNETLKKIIVSGNVTEIGEGAFKNMVNLQSLEVPFVGKTVNADAYYLETPSAHDKSVDRERTIAHFFGDTTYKSGTKLAINDGVNVNYCFVPKDFNEIIINATKVAEGKTSYSIPRCAFNGATNLNKVVLKGDKLGGVGESAFANCTKLEQVIVEGSNLNVRENAFKGCARLKYFGKSVQTLPSYQIDLSSVSVAGEKAFDMGSQTYSVINAGSINLDLVFGETERK